MVLDFDTPVPEYLNSEYISTGIEKLDTVLEGGVRKGEFLCLLARYQHGKTSFLTILGANAYISGQTVLHFVYEDRVADIYEMYTTILKDRNMKKEYKPRLDHCTHE